MRKIKKGSMTHLACLAIKRAKRPLTTKEIYSEVMKSFKSKGMTPRATLTSILNKNGLIFKKIRKGTYDLYSYD